MPYHWVDPDLFMEMEDVAIYYCYRDDEIVSIYWYSTDPSDSDYKYPLSDAQFDVRDLPNLGLDVNNAKNHPAIIEQAIKAGILIGEPAVREPPAVAKIEVIGGVAHVIEQPPGVEVEIIDHDKNE